MKAKRLNNSFVRKEEAGSHLVCTSKSGLVLTFACTIWLDVVAMGIGKHGTRFQELVHGMKENTVYNENNTEKQLWNCFKFVMLHLSFMEMQKTCIDENSSNNTFKTFNLYRDTYFET
jgi:hypothetical protein